MFKKPCPCGCGKSMGFSDRKWVELMLETRANVDRLDSAMTGTTERVASELTDDERADPDVVAMQKRLEREFRTFVSHGRNIANDLEGWTHRRSDVRLDLAKTKMWNGDVREVLAEIEGLRK